MFIEKRLKKLYEFDKQTPLYFNIEEPLDVLQDYDEAELYKIIQFDKEIKGILEPFLAVCFTARLVYENIEQMDLTQTTFDIINYDLLIREFELLDLLKDIAIYYEFIELKSGTIAYHTNLNMIIKSLKHLLCNIENLIKKEKNEYIKDLLNTNIELMKTEIFDNKKELKKEFREILKKSSSELSFQNFSLIVVEYCLAIFKQDNLIDSLNYFSNIKEILLSSGIDTKEKKNIIESFIILEKLYKENQRIQTKLIINQSGKGLK